MAEIRDAKPQPQRAGSEHAANAPANAATQGSRRGRSGDLDAEMSLSPAGVDQALLEKVRAIKIRASMETVE